MEGISCDGAQIATTGAKGTGGATCFGDWGGPFFPDAKTVVAVTSWGSQPDLRLFD